MKRYPYGIQMAAAALAQHLMKRILLVLPADPHGHVIIEHDDGATGDAALARHTAMGAHWWLFDESGGLVDTTEAHDRKAVEAAIGEAIGTLSGADKKS